MDEEETIIPQENELVQKAKPKTGFRIKKARIMQIWSISSLVIIVLLIGIMYFQSTESSSSVQVITAEKAGEQTVDFINQNLVSTGEATLVSVEEESGNYKVIVSYQEQDIPLYVSKDGTLLFQGTIDMEEVIEQPDQPDQPAPQPEEVPKSDNPQVNAFIMSYCPYGLQFLKAYIPVLELLDGKADMSLNFVSYIMHGEKEIDENNRMYCIQRDQSDKLTEYLRCFVESDDWEACYSSVGIDKGTVDACISEIDETYKITELYNDQSTWSGGRYPQYPVDGVLASQYGVGGSPTFVINGKTLSVNRISESIKQAVCSSFNTPPSECDQTLSTAAQAPGIGAIASGSGGSAPAASGSAQCG
jgi:protein-disulfide isomerase